MPNNQSLHESSLKTTNHRYISRTETDHYFSAFYRYSVWEKQSLGFLNISKNLQKKQQKKCISRIFWAFESWLKALKIIHAPIYIVYTVPSWL